MGPKGRCVGQPARHHCHSWLVHPYPSKAICSCTLSLTYLIDTRFHLPSMAGLALTNSQPDSSLLLTHVQTATTSQVLYRARRLQPENRLFAYT